MTSGNPPSLEPLVVGVSGRRMVVQGVATGLFGVLLLVGAAALDSWYLGLLPADPKQRSQAQKSVDITGGAPYSANLAAASISNDRALEAVRNLAQGRTTVG